MLYLLSSAHPPLPTSSGWFNTPSSIFTMGIHPLFSCHLLASLFVYYVSSRVALPSPLLALGGFVPSFGLQHHPLRFNAHPSRCSSIPLSAASPSIFGLSHSSHLRLITLCVLCDSHLLASTSSQHAFQPRSHRLRVFIITVAIHRALISTCYPWLSCFV